MIPKYRAWSTDKKIMAEVRTLRFTDELVETDKFVERSIEGVKIMQSTGLLDKNGKEIFEKDILDYNGRKVIVKRHGSYACFIYEFVDELKNRTAEWQPLYLSYYNFEIVGNSLENPELLEVTE